MRLDIERGNQMEFRKQRVVNIGDNSGWFVGETKGTLINATVMHRERGVIPGCIPSIKSVAIIDGYNFSSSSEASVNAYCAILESSIPWSTKKQMLRDNIFK